MFNRFYPVVVIYAATVAIGLATRVAIIGRDDSPSANLTDLLVAVVTGTGFDVVVAAYLTAPLALLLAVLPGKWVRSRLVRTTSILVVCGSFHLLFFVAIAEWVFWEEFAARFNFIAVDYLIYTHEVLGNIRESYPVGKILLGLATLATLAGLLSARSIWKRMGLSSADGWAPLPAFVALLGTVLFTLVISSDTRPQFDREFEQELSGNGIYQFFSAFRNNTLDFPRYFATIPDDDALDIMRKKLTSAGELWPKSPMTELERIVLAPEREKGLNVVLVSVESLGSEFVGALGSDKQLTPNLDRLAKESLLFTNLYATGNRTVRGLEALSLSIPPTPGESIVKRPGASEMFTLGSVLEDKGYESLFMYGGYGYFDNMNEFFSKNDYRVFDRTAIPKEKVHYENIWGVADEDLFGHALEELDRVAGKPFFAHIMTTSNHRPYTYPEGRIDIPSGSGRDGAVKYTDYALGQFIASAKRRSWFGKTIFIITADHGASARGTMDIPVEQYRIPLLVYSPGRINPDRVDRLMSQIDIPPTVLGLLGLSYRTKFFGHDIFRAPPSEDRAFVATDQTLGYIRDGQLVSLSPRRGVRVNPLRGERPADSVEKSALTREAIAWYLTAYRLYHSRKYQDEESNKADVVLSLRDVKHFD